MIGSGRKIASIFEMVGNLVRLSNTSSLSPFSFPAFIHLLLKVSSL